MTLAQQLRYQRREVERTKRRVENARDPEEKSRLERDLAYRRAILRTLIELMRRATGTLPAKAVA
jgi:hypothetical protein